MEPNQQQEAAHNPATDTDISQDTAVPQPTPVTSDAAISDSSESPPIPIAQIVVGMVFLSVSIGSGVALIGSLIPSVTLEAPAAQAAAVVASVPEVFPPVTLEARSAYVYDVKDDKELYSEKGSIQLPLASITKVALVLTVSEVLSPESVVTISRVAVERGGGGLTWGEEWRVRDLIDYTLITSSNTGAEALREAADPLLAQKYPAFIGGSATIYRMNALAEQLGMNETYFLNATGLDESPTQAGALSSARDVATMFTFALRFHRDLFSGTAKAEVPLSPSNAPERDARNTNNALSAIPHIIMGKTGTTDLAGGNVAIAFNIDEDHPVIVVVMGSGLLGRYTDMETLVAAAKSMLASRD